MSITRGKDLARDPSSRLSDSLFSAWTEKNVAKFHQIALWEALRPPSLLNKKGVGGDYGGRRPFVIEFQAKKLSPAFEQFQALPCDSSTWRVWN